MKPFPSCLLLLVGLASGPLFAQSSDLTQPELKKNKIEGIFEYRQSPCNFDRDKSNADQWKAAMWTDSRNWYDARGNLTGKYEFGKYSAAPVIKSYKYDDENNLIEQETDYIKYPVHHKITRNDKGKVLEDISSSERHTFKYNPAGGVIETAVFDLDDGRLSDKKTYNDRGDLIDALIYDSYDPPGHLAKIVYTYDVAGHRNKGEVYDLAGHLYSIIVYTYDEAGHNTKQQEFASDGKTLKRWSTFKRDPNGLVTESSSFNAKGECTWLTKTSYKFYP